MMARQRFRNISRRMRRLPPIITRAMPTTIAPPCSTAEPVRLETKRGARRRTEDGGRRTEDGGRRKVQRVLEGTPDASAEPGAAPDSTRGGPSRPQRHQSAACLPAPAPGESPRAGRALESPIRPLAAPTSDPGGGHWLCSAPPPPGEGSSVARTGGAISRPTLCRRRYGRPSTTPAEPAVTQASDRSRSRLPRSPAFRRARIVSAQDRRSREPHRSSRDAARETRRLVARGEDSCG